MGDVGVNVTREVVEEEHTAHHVFELAASMYARSFSAIAQSLFPHPGMAPPLFLSMHTVRVYPSSAGAQPLPKAGAQRTLEAVGSSARLSAVQP
jgi:hypothetical protein